MKQAQRCLSVVEDFDKTLLVLDFEPNTTAPAWASKRRGQRAFVTHVKDATGRYPGFYSGHYIKQLLGMSRDLVLPMRQL